jgi:hypothetical protein
MSSVKHHILMKSRTRSSETDAESKVKRFDRSFVPDLDGTVLTNVRELGHLDTIEMLNVLLVRTFIFDGAMSQQ